MTTMTMKAVRDELRAIGLTVTRRDDVYRVNYAGGTEPSACYVDDLVDALDTGRAMAKERDAKMTIDAGRAANAMAQRLTGGDIGARPFGAEALVILGRLVHHMSGVALGGFPECYRTDNLTPILREADELMRQLAVRS